MIAGGSIARFILLQRRCERLASFSHPGEQCTATAEELSLERR